MLYGTVYLFPPSRHAPRKTGRYTLYSPPYGFSMRTLRTSSTAGDLFIPEAAAGDMRKVTGRRVDVTRNTRAEDISRTRKIPVRIGTHTAMPPFPEFRGLARTGIELHLIENSNRENVKRLFEGYPETGIMHTGIDGSYLPRFDPEGRRTKWGFWIRSGDEIAGLCLLGISSWDNLRGYTGTDILGHMRGRGIAPATKPLLFFLGFHHLGLNRIETGCFVSNISSQRAIEKTKGFQFEGILRAYALNSEGIYEDERRYAILRRDWERLHDVSGITVLP